MPRLPPARLAPALLLALLAGCSPLPAALGGGGRDRPLPADPTVVQGVLPNGLRYYVRENREPPARAELRLAVRVGSILEDEDQRGLAHFVEHMAFNGTAGFEKQELVSWLERAGMRFGADVNAYTSFDETVYTLTLPTDSAELFETGLRILDEWASAVAFDSAEVEAERGVVMEEWRLTQGAGARTQEKQLPVLLGRSRYADRLPIGTPESLRTFDQAALRRFYRDWYRPDLMAVVAVGDFDARKVEAQIRERFGDLAAPVYAPIRAEHPVPRHEETVVSVATDPEATSSSVSLYLKREPVVWSTVSAYRRWLVETLAAGMLVNRLSEWTQRADSPFLDVSSYQGRFLQPLAVYLFTVRVPEEGVARGLEGLLLEMERADRHGFTRTELAREKETTRRRIEQRYLERERTTSSSLAAEHVSSFVYGGALVSIEDEYALQRELLDEIRPSEVNAVAREWLSDANRVVLVSAPARAAAPPPDEAALHAVIASVRGREEVAPYVDSVSTAPLLRERPRAGRVVAERRFPEVGITEWTLSNGARLLLKPTDYRPDETLFAGWSPGGVSLVSDEDHLAGLTASAVVQAGGVGELTVSDLTKRLAATVVGVGTEIGETGEFVSGGGSPRDLETLFQLVHLKFTAPRLDSAAVEAYRAQGRALLANQAASPEAVFYDSLRATLTGDHPRSRPLRSEDFDRLDPRRSLEIYRERFADAADFTFYLVGSYDEAEARALAERYLASLPSTRTPERARDLGIRPPRGVVTTTVRKGLEPKALTQLVFTGPVEFGREAVYTVNALSELLQIRLREALREELGGTYGVQVGAGVAREPVERYQLSVGFGSEPARVDELTRVAFAEIERLQREGPTADEVQKVRETGIRARETDMRSNSFWMAQMMSYDRNRWEMRGILEYPGWMARLDGELLRAAAARFLDRTNYVHATLLPESLPAGPGR